MLDQNSLGGGFQVTMFISAIKLGMLTWETPGTDSLLELQVHVRNCRV